jgi:hypothetical protein
VVFLPSKKLFLILTGTLLVLGVFLSGCNPAQVGQPKQGAGDPAELKVQNIDSSGIPILKPVGKPVLIMFTGNY